MFIGDWDIKQQKKQSRQKHRYIGVLIRGETRLRLPVRNVGANGQPLHPT